ncbi:MerR family transcriptional regulator [Pseudalkalibacillus caeni]|uniref:Chromosome-anchoring protein RacA n=1 Tax=Exobacillus caeni TaxID=2574798 RepID=A0A5R9F4X2_9BACL|nr:MerR family transcriptional regulator [Pseudalkalibacillus caeni]TLS35873.1 MerR family transcriptional regulator [Pseudalkalibacillus caeni]
MALKTKKVSEELGVNPTTVQRWVKYFDLPCEKNELGHYLFEQKDILLLKNVKDQLSDGRSMEEVVLPGLPKEKPNKKQPSIVSTEKMEQRLDRFSLRLEQLERQIEEKANEVITVQILQHRTEIDELVKKISHLEEKLEMIETHTVKEEPDVNSIEKAKRSWIMSLFSF